MKRCLVCLLLAACGGDDEPAEPVDQGPAVDFDELSLDVCATGPFSLVIDNPYCPLPVGRVLVLEGDDDGTLVHVEITVLDEVELVGSFQTRVVEEAESEDGEIVEISRNYFAQASDGTVCYFGEEVDAYEGGEVADHHGSWRADDDGAQAGIVMPGTPVAETQFFQEQAPDVAEDKSAIMAVGDAATVPAGTFDDTVETLDWSPLEGQTSAAGEGKRYARDVGLIVDEVAELVDYTP